jgi:hypothetical protein
LSEIGVFHRYDDAVIRNNGLPLGISVGVIREDDHPENKTGAFEVTAAPRSHVTLLADISRVGAT